MTRALKSERTKATAIGIEYRIEYTTEVFRYFALFFHEFTEELCNYQVDGIQISLL